MPRACVPRRPVRGLTLIELMIAIAVVALLATVALPSYRASILKSKARTASTDLVALGVALENRFQKTLQYPVYASATTIPAALSARSGSLATDFGSWAPAQADLFSYAVQSDAVGYTLTATAGEDVSCTLTLTSDNVRSVSGSDCGFSAW